MQEFWMPVAGYENHYAVSDIGRIKRIRGGKGTRAGMIIRQRLNKRTGRMIVNLSKNDVQKTFDTHSLVISAFVGPRPQNLEVCHNNGIATDNRLENLRYDTKENNERDKVKHGTSNRGERQGNSKLTASQVLAIRADKRTQQSIADSYGIDRSHVSDIKNRYRWAHL